MSVTSKIIDSMSELAFGSIRANANFLIILTKSDF